MIALSIVRLRARPTYPERIRMGEVVEMFSDWLRKAVRRQLEVSYDAFCLMADLKPDAW